MDANPGGRTRLFPQHGVIPVDHRWSSAAYHHGSPRVSSPYSKLPCRTLLGRPFSLGPRRRHVAAVNPQAMPTISAISLMSASGIARSASRAAGFDRAGALRQNSIACDCCYFG